MVRDEAEEKEKELKKIKRETEIWKFINKKKDNKTWNENTIGKEEWRRFSWNYWMERS